MLDYSTYPVKPYVSPERHLETDKSKPVPRRNMEPLEDGLLAGDIILLWRIQFGTFTTETIYSKYFEYSYGIHGPSHLESLLEKGYVRVESPFESLDHITSQDKKEILKSLGVKGLSKLKAADLDQALAENIEDSKLGTYFTVRGLALTEKGQKTLTLHQEIVDRHPQKKF